MSDKKRKKCLNCDGRGKIHLADCRRMRPDVLTFVEEPCTCGNPVCGFCHGTGVRARHAALEGGN